MKTERQIKADLDEYIKNAVNELHDVTGKEVKGITVFITDTSKPYIYNTIGTDIIYHEADHIDDYVWWKWWV